MWVKFRSLTQAVSGEHNENPIFWSHTDLTSGDFNRYSIGIYSGNIAGYFIAGNVLQGSYTTAWEPSLDTWYHIAVVRSSVTTPKALIFVDGVSKPVTEVVSLADKDLVNINGEVWIGTLWYTPSGETPSAKYPVNGWIDEFRFSKGIARWTNDFTKPTVPY